MAILCGAWALDCELSFNGGRSNTERELVCASSFNKSAIFMVAKILSNGVECEERERLLIPRNMEIGGLTENSRKRVVRTVHNLQAKIQTK